jgi:hypothetical protein
MNNRALQVLRKLAAEKAEGANNSKPKKGTNQEAMSRILANIASKSAAMQQPQARPKAAKPTQTKPQPAVKTQPTKAQKDAEQRVNNRPESDDDTIKKQARAWGLM